MNTTTEILQVYNWQELYEDFCRDSLEPWLYRLSFCGAYQRNRARPYGLIDEAEQPDQDNVKLIKTANERISQWMDEQF